MNERLESQASAHGQKPIGPDGEGAGNASATGSGPILWITWEDQIRNVSMSAAMGAELVVLKHAGPRLAMYWNCLLKTLRAISRRQPRVVVGQNPSVVLTAFIHVLRPFFRYTHVIDAHFGGVIAFNGSRTFQRTLDYLNRHADLVIVTNPDHAIHVQKAGGVALVCEDPLPTLIDRFLPKELPSQSVFFICSFDIDEPYVAAFQAFERLQTEGYSFFVSGNFRKAGISPADYPSVTFLGFVPQADFYGYLAGCAVAVDLTLHESCLVCGAYESMQAEKPLVTSDRVALRNHFTAGAVFTGHAPEEIAAAIRDAYERREALSREIVAWKPKAASATAKRIAEIHAKIAS